MKRNWCISTTGAPDRRAARKPRTHPATVSVVSRAHDLAAVPMPTLKRHKKSENEHTHLAVRIERYEARVEAAINHSVYAPQYTWDLDDDDPLYEFTTQLLIYGVTTYPEKRAGDAFELTVYGVDASSRLLRATLKDSQARDEHGSPRYRSYRGRQIPIYIPPHGMGPIEKIRGEARWAAWLQASPRFIEDALLLLSRGGSLFLGIDERKDGRVRSFRSVTVQTTDPADD